MSGTFHQRFIPVLAVSAFTFTGAQIACADMGSWTQYMSNAQHTGYVASDIDANAIRPLWSLDKITLAEYSLIAGAVTDSDSIYLSAQRLQPVYTANNYDVISFDRLTGAVNWTKTLSAYSPYEFSAPSLGNGNLYVEVGGHSGISGGNSSQYPSITALNPQTGSQVFRSTYAGQWLTGSRPTVIGDRLYSIGGYYGGVDGYNAISGNKLWSAPTQALLNASVSPAADSRYAYYWLSRDSYPETLDGRLAIYDRNTGAQTYIINDNAPYSGLDCPVVLPNETTALVLASGSGGRVLVNFDLANKNVRWTSAASNNLGMFATAGNTIFIANGTHLDLLDLATGNIMGQWDVPDAKSLAQVPIVVTDNLIFAGVISGGTYALDRQTLDVVWHTSEVGELSLGNDVLVISNPNTISVFAVPEPMTIAWLLAAPAFALLRRRPTRTPA